MRSIRSLRAKTIASTTTAIIASGANAKPVSNFRIRTIAVVAISANSSDVRTGSWFRFMSEPTLFTLAGGT